MTKSVTAKSVAEEIKESGRTKHFSKSIKGGFMQRVFANINDVHPSMMSSTSYNSQEVELYKCINVDILLNRLEKKLQGGSEHHCIASEDAIKMIEQFRNGEQGAC